MSKAPTRIVLSHEEIMAAMIDAIKKKAPNLADEEFEIQFTYSSYDHMLSAVVDVQ
jgi:hypothetical protein